MVRWPVHNLASVLRHKKTPVKQGAVKTGHVKAGQDRGGIVGVMGAVAGGWGEKSRGDGFYFHVLLPFGHI